MDTGNPSDAADKAHLGAVKTILSLGEERMGEVVNQLLSNERFVSAVQGAISSSLNAKRSVDKGLARFFGLINVPTLENVEQVREKMAEVEEALVAIHERVRSIDERISRRAQPATDDASEPKSAPKKKAGAAKKKPAADEE